MPNEENFFKETKEKLQQYVQQQLLLIRLQATDKISGIVSKIIVSILVVIVGLFLLIFASVTAGLWLATLTGSFVAGFGIVALFYFVVFLFVIIFLKNIIRNHFINKLISLFNKKS